MPELPEVETIKLSLSQKLIGLKIKKITLLNPKSFDGNFKGLYGLEIKTIWRRAKVLGIDLVGGVTLLIHLKMSGQLVYQNGQRIIGGHPTLDMTGSMPNNSTRVIFEFNDDSKLFFNDQRKFGWIKIVNKEQLASNSLLKKLGPEPFDKNFTWKILKENLLKHKSQPVKTAILDQTTIAGVGNIYASEACFLAKLDPRTKIKDLTDSDFRGLYEGIKKSLGNGLKHGGSTIANFINPEGEKGYYLDYAYVYFKAGKPCKICLTKIEKFQLNGRGTYVCPNCQLAPTL